LHVLVTFSVVTCMLLTVCQITASVGDNKLILILSYLILSYDQSQYTIIILFFINKQIGVCNEDHKTSV